MEISALQAKIHEEYSGTISELSLDYGVARLLVQTGQLGEAVVHEGDVAKELADVIFVLVSIADRCEVDLAAAVDEHIGGRSTDEILDRINVR